MSDERQSGTVKLLQGKLYPGHNSPIKDITAKGNTRIVHLKDGSMVETTKRQVAKAFESALTAEGYKRARQSARTLPDGKVEVTIGGRYHGHRKAYSTKGRALSALKRRYGQ